MDVRVVPQLLCSMKRPIFQSAHQAEVVPDQAFRCKADQETGGLGRAEGSGNRSLEGKNKNFRTALLTYGMTTIELRVVG